MVLWVHTHLKLEGLPRLREEKHKKNKKRRNKKREKKKETKKTRKKARPLAQKDWSRRKETAEGHGFWLTPNGLAIWVNGFSANGQVQALESLCCQFRVPETS